jgi:prepilin peptidase CpaA
MSILPDLLTGGLLFAFTFPFWLGRLIGAGDVKLLAVSGFIVGIDDVLELAVLTLGFSIVSIVVIGYGRYLLLLPAAFNRRLETILKQGRIPYGVPVSLAAICIVGAKLGSAI